MLDGRIPAADGPRSPHRTGLIRTRMRRHGRTAGWVHAHHPGARRGGGRRRLRDWNHSRNRPV